MAICPNAQIPAWTPMFFASLPRSLEVLPQDLVGISTLPGAPPAKPNM